MDNMGGLSYSSYYTNSIITTAHRPMKVRINYSIAQANHLI